MNTIPPLLECVPNFSEGRSETVIAAITAAISRVQGQSLLHLDASAAANRTVFTFAGTPEAVIEAAYQAIKVAADHIDMRLQKGTHPRLGATDVCPLVPLRGITNEEAVQWSRILAQKVGTQLHIPVYLYEQSASAAYRQQLPHIRKGQYEGLFDKMQLPDWQPDYGPTIAGNWDKYIAKTGATIIGARDVLVALNISLNTKDERIATAIARRMRSSSKGLLPSLRAIGWFMEDFDCAQVSMNLLDYRVTSPLTVWETCKMLAAEYGVVPVGCEVVGLIPEACVLEAGAKAMVKGNGEHIERATLVKEGIDYLGLNKVKPFILREKILEYALADKGLIE